MMIFDKKWLQISIGTLFLTSWIGMAVILGVLIHKKEDPARGFGGDLSSASDQKALASMVKNLSLNVNRQEKILKDLEKNISFVQDAIFAEKIESIVQGCTTDQERVLAVARWISSSISNKDAVGNTFGSFAARMGLCGGRSQIFLKAMDLFYIPAHGFNMYNFGGVGGGHSCAQAFYGDKWHFFDVTYAGVFIKNGDVLSWEEIVANPEEALRHLVVFPETLDRFSSGKRVDNEKRMRSVYTPKAIAGSLEQSGPLRETLKILTINVDAASLPFVVGEKDGSAADVEKIGDERQLTEQLSRTLHTYFDFFHVRWRLNNLTAGKSYRLTYTLLEPRKEKMAYWAKITGAKITAGEVYTGPAPGAWTIEFTAQSPEASILCGYDSRELGLGPEIDRITIVALP